jgi:hypothetical protein
LYQSFIRRKAIPISEHLELQRHASPFDTRSLIVLPRWYAPTGKSWQRILSNYKVIHTYHAGTYLFRTATSATDSAPMSPTHWPVDIYLADHTLEERHAAAWDG